MNADIQRLIKHKPRYKEPLTLLQSVLNFQAKLAEKIEPAPQIEADAAREKWRAGQPLFDAEPPSIPAPLFREALTDLRPLLAAEESAQAAIDRLLDADIEALLNNLTSDSESGITQLAETTSTDPDTLTFLLRTALTPFFEKQAAPYREQLATAGWRRGICPICGSEPAMARLTQDEGRRILSCSLCRAEWAFDRLRCPFCVGNAEPQMNYFTIDNDETHRVDCCNHCHRYIKTVDERVLGRPVNLLVEDVITAHLDEVAKEQGYQ